MRSLEVRLPVLPGELVDLDVGLDRSFVAITAQVERSVVPGYAGESVVYSDQQLVFDRDAVVPVPSPCRFPVVRALPNGLAVVVDKRTARESSNAWLMDRRAGVVGAFRPGDGVADVLACGDRIVVTYFDEGIFRGDVPSYEGVAIFDARGSFEWGYHSQFGESAPSIADCYAACVDERDRLLISPYTEFPVVRIDVAARTCEVFPAPDDVRGAAAMSAIDDRVLFAGAYHGQNAVFELILGSDSAREVGTYPGTLRGLRGGEFVALGANSYTIVSPDGLDV